MCNPVEIARYGLWSVHPGIDVRESSRRCAWLPRVDDTTFAPSLRQALNDGYTSVIISDCRNRRDLEAAHVMAEVAEIEAGIEPWSIRLIAAVAASAEGALDLAALAHVTPRLEALAYHPGALAEALGVARTSAVIDRLGDACLLTARACGVEALVVEDRDRPTAPPDGFYGFLSPAERLV